MPIFIRNPDLDRRLQKLAEAQTPPSDKHTLVLAMLKRSTDACDLTGNPLAWNEIGNAATGSNPARQDIGHSANGPSQESPTAVNGASRAARERGKKGQTA